MGIEIVLKIAGIGILVAVACQLLKQTGRDDIAMITALAGLVIVLTMVISLIAALFLRTSATYSIYTEMDIFRAAGIAVLTAMLAVTLRSVKPELGAQTAAAGGVILMLAAAGELSGIAEAVKRFVSLSGIGADPAALVLKVAGIAYIAQTASDICRDMGEASLASGAELCGRLMMLSAALPMLTELIDSLAELIGEYL